MDNLFIIISFSCHHPVTEYWRTLCVRDARGILEKFWGWGGLGQPFFPELGRGGACIPVVTATDVDDEDRVGNSLLQIWEMRFGHKANFFRY